jgi:amino acid transporter
MTINTSPRAVGLRPNCLSFPEVLAQSIALIAPTATPAANIALTYASAGNGTWLAYLIATIGLVFVSLNINQFARHSASAGALYTYVARGLGPMPGFLCGWSLTLGYLATAACCSGAFAHYANTVLGEFGLQLPSIVLFALCAVIAWYYAYTDIQLTTILMLLLELAAVGVVLVLAFIILSQHEFHLDMAQLTLADTTPSGISLGVVIGILSFIGFESSTTLGDEAKRPTRFIPQSLIWSTVLAGLFFILLSYTEVLGFQGYRTALNESSSPLGDLSNLAGMDLLGIGLGVGITFSFFSCFLACINAASRIAYSLARHHIFPTPLGAAHIHNETPYIAVSLSAFTVFFIASSISLFGIQDMDLFSYMGTIATFGLLAAYILVSIAAPFYLLRQNRLRQHHIVISLLAVFFMLIPVIGSLYPPPSFPFNIFPYLFMLYLVMGGVLFSMLRLRSPRINQSLVYEPEPVPSRND